MTRALESEKQDLHFFAQSPALLFQFILSEFLQTYQSVQEIDSIYKEMETLLIKRRLLADAKNCLVALLDRIDEISGSSSIDDAAFSWNLQRGSLNKLRHYCFPFVNQFEAKEGVVVNLNICVSKAFHTALQIKEVIIYLIQENNQSKKIPDYAMLYQLLDRLIDNINRASRLILRIILSFREDENIVYFLLRKRAEFDHSYKTSFVAKLFAKMYPEGVEEAGRLLIKRYSKRGFKHLLNNITRKISEIRT